jgi:hypothetical protein
MVPLYFMTFHWFLSLILITPFCCQCAISAIPLQELGSRHWSHWSWVYSPTFSHLYSLALFSQDILPLTRLCVCGQEGLIKSLLCLGETIDLVDLPRVFIFSCPSAPMCDSC